MPDNYPHLHKIHGQVSWKDNKKAKSTYLTEIEDRIKRYGGKNQGPGDYPYEKNPIEGKQTKRYLWDKEKRQTFLEVITKYEKAKKGPADYKTVIKQRVTGNYLQK